MPTSLFGAIEMAPRDPILGVTEAFVADQNPRKVNLGVGVYNDDSGKLPLLECVRQVERELSAKAASRGLAFNGMLAAIAAIPAGDVIVLHACCHNPTGVDPTDEQWTSIITHVRARGLMPVLDLAYQGFGDGIDADASVVRRFAATP